jgi:bifunctional DNA-binding transcriptional regulator/antitoxin component of YhaV-PrlF toxin-antitoxin module
MSRVTSKHQVTIPKAIALAYAISPGDEIEWLAAGDTIRVLPGPRPGGCDGQAERLALFDAATARQLRRQRRTHVAHRARARGWTREELYERGRSR